MTYLHFLIIIILWGSIINELQSDLPRDSYEIYFQKYSFSHNNRSYMKLYSTGSQYWTIESCLGCLSFSSWKLFCEDGEYLFIKVRKSHYYDVRLTFNISCMEQYTNQIYGMKQNSSINSISISWYTYNNYEGYYVCLRRRDEFKCLTKEDNMYHTFEDLNEKTIYEFCISAVKYELLRGYKCGFIGTDFRSTGPITYLKEISKNSTSIVLSWKKPNYLFDNPEGYVVNYTSFTDGCRSVIIYMTDFKLTEKPPPSCGMDENITTWDNIKHLTLSQLSADTFYQIEIAPWNRNRRQYYEILGISTKKKNCAVFNIQIIPHFNESIKIQFEKPENTEGEITSFDIKISLDENIICKELSDKVIYESTINSYERDKVFDHWVNTQLWQCGRYWITVESVYTNETSKPTTSTLYNHNNNISSISSFTQAQFLSNNLLRITFDKSVNFSCENLGIVMEVFETSNYNICSIMIIIWDNICVALNDKINEKFNCTNKILLVLNRKKLGSQFINGNFNNNSTHSVNIWDINRQISLIYSNILSQTFTDCFSDCYDNEYIGIRSATISSQVCIPWQNSNLSRRSNYCTLTEKYCWCYTQRGHENCDIPKCSLITRGTGCVKYKYILVEKYKVHIQWVQPDYPDYIIGYITLLHNTDLTCEQSHIQTCSHCISVESLKNKVQNFYLACQTKIVDKSLLFQSKFSSLSQNRRYIIYVIPILSNSEVGEIKKFDFKTDLAVPATPEQIQVTRIRLELLEFKWKTQLETSLNGKADMYQARLINMESRSEKHGESRSGKIRFNHLKPCSKYCLFIKANNIAGSSPETIGHVCAYTNIPTLKQIIIHKPNDVPPDNTYTERTISLVFDSPTQCIKYYRIKYLIKYQNDKIITESKEKIFTLKNLKKFVLYTIHIAAKTNWNNWKYKTKEFYNGPEVPNITSIEVSSSSNLVAISMKVDEHISQSIYAFLIKFINERLSCIKCVVLVCRNCKNEYIKNHLSSSIREQINNISNCLSKANQSHFSINEDLVEIKINYDKLSNFTIEIFAVNFLGIHLVYSNSLPSQNKSKSNSKYFYLILVITILVGLLLAIIMSRQLKKKRRQNTVQQQEICSLGNTQQYIDTIPKINKPGEVSINRLFLDFGRKYKDNEITINMNEFMRLEIDSADLERRNNLSSNVGKLVENVRKNRYLNIIPYDETRVIVRGTASLNDYINASWIPFIKDSRKYEYIAAQDPVKHSILDFWQMILETHVNIIVMLTKVSEDYQSKSVRYWPDIINKKYTFGQQNEIEVFLTNEDKQIGFREKIFLVNNKKNCESRKIIHLHMEDWSEVSTPKFEHFDNLISRFNELKYSVAHPPFLIHCSNGVGLTGVFICIDRLIQSRNIDLQDETIYKTVLQLRQHRPLMVEKQIQYSFIRQYMKHYSQNRSNY